MTSITFNIADWAAIAILVVILINTGLAGTLAIFKALILREERKQTKLRHDHATKIVADWGKET